MDSELAQFILPRRLERMKEVLENRTEQVTLVLDQVHHEHNVSAVLRSADAFGIQNVHLVGLGGKFSSGITQGAERWLTLYRHKSAEESISALQKENYKLAIVEPVEKGSKLKSYPVGDLPFNEKIALIFGSEKQGIGEIFRSRADMATHVPMHGFVESFNISVAAAICMFCSSISSSGRRRQLPSLSERRKEEILNSWIEGDLRDAEATKQLLAKRK